MDLTPENFDRLLSWLHPDREEAGKIYEKIRAQLIRKFIAHGRSNPDELTDRTVTRVAQILTPRMIEDWEGEKLRLFYRVAYYIRLEPDPGDLESELPENLEIPSPVYENVEPEFYCLEKCKEGLSTEDCELITKYYYGDRATKIRNRKELAKEFGVTLAVLRVKAHRIRKRLKTCIRRCLAQTGNATTLT
jgi:hypothetical protein